MATESEVRSFLSGLGYSRFEASKIIKSSGIQFPKHKKSRRRTKAQIASLEKRRNHPLYWPKSADATMTEKLRKSNFLFTHLHHKPTDEEAEARRIARKKLRKLSKIMKLEHEFTGESDW